MIMSSSYKQNIGDESSMYCFGECCDGNINRCPSHPCKIMRVATKEEFMQQNDKDKGISQFEPYFYEVSVD